MKAFLLSTSIVALFVTSIIFTTPAAAVQGVGGWYLDKSSCSLSEIAFLNRYLGRARIAHINLATYFDTYGKTNEFNRLVWQVLGGEDPVDAMVKAYDVFMGGFELDQDGFSEIQGLASWKGPISEEEAYNSPNGLVASLSMFYTFLALSLTSLQVVYCDARRLGRVRHRAVTQDKRTNRIK